MAVPLPPHSGGYCAKSEMTTTTQNYSDYRLEVSVSEPSNPQFFKGKACYRLVFTVDAAFNMPDAVFVHQRSLPIDNLGTCIDTFISVAGPYDLISMGEIELDEKRMFRKNSVSVALSSPELAVTFVAEVKQALQELLDSLSRLDLLKLREQFNVNAYRETSTTTTV